MTTEGREWRRSDTQAIISEVDPRTKKIGKILAIVRNEGVKFVVYTYFRAYPGQPVSFLDRDFYQGNMFRHGEVANNKKGCVYSVATGLADHGRDFVTPQLEATITTGLKTIRRKEWMLDLRDPKTKETKLFRQTEIDGVTVKVGINLLVAVCLIYASETIMND